MREIGSELRGRLGGRLSLGLSVELSGWFEGVGLLAMLEGIECLVELGLEDASG